MDRDVGEQEMVRREIDAAVDDEAPTGGRITEYDERHLATYLRLLDAAAQRVHWKHGARNILGRDPAEQTRRVKRCWDSHLKRARWISEHGYRQLLK